MAGFKPKARHSRVLHSPRYCLFSLVALLTTACSADAVSTSLTPVPSAIAPQVEPASVSLLYQGNADQLTLADVAIAHAVTLLPPGQRGNTFIASVASDILGDPTAVTTADLTPSTINFAAEAGQLDISDTAVLLAALNLPIEARSAGNLATAANILLQSDSSLTAAQILNSARAFQPPPETVTTDSGLQFIDWIEGSGETPQERQSVTVHYIGKVNDSNGIVFDSSYQRGQPQSFVLGIGSLIPGWEEGMSTMQVGGKRSLVISPELGYGDVGVPDAGIPPNATLYFEILLLDISD